MAKILVTQVGEEIIANGQTREIYLPPIDRWVSVDEEERKKKAGSRGSIWNPEMEEAVKEFKAGQIRDLAGGCKIRMGWSAALIITQEMVEAPVFIEFDGDHPVRPCHLTPPAGIWEPGRNPLETALSELGEEIIITQDNSVGFWVHDNQVLAEDWVRNYAEYQNFGVNEELKINVERIEEFDNAITLSFGQERMRCLVTFEPDSGSIEGIVPLRAFVPPDVQLVDGERNSEGEYLDREILYGESTTEKPKTTKANKVIETFGIRRI